MAVEPLVLRRSEDRHVRMLLLDLRDSLGRGNEIEENIAYRTFPMKTVKVVRLTITGWGEGLTPAVVSFSVFGKRSEKL